MTLPSDVSARVSWFDRVAERASLVVSRAPFFTFCVLLIVIWVPTLGLLEINTSQLIINTVTTIVTFLLVALLQNSQTRANNAVQHKLNAISDALADLLYEIGFDEHSAELRAAVGLENRESA